MLWKFPNDKHLIALDLVQLVKPIDTHIVPAEGSYAETRQCFFQVVVAGHTIDICVSDYDNEGMLTPEAWNQKLDELEADYDALVWQLTGALQTPPQVPAEDKDGLKDEVVLLNSTSVTSWHHKEEADGQVRLSLEALLPDHPQTDELIHKLMEYAHRVRVPDIRIDESPLGSAAL